MPALSDTDLIARLGEASGHLVEDPEILAEWASDWSPLSFKLPVDEAALPAVAFVPDSAADVAAVLRIAAAAGRPVAVKGGGSNTWGAIRPTAGGVLIDTRGLGVIGPIDETVETVTVDVGVVGGELEARLNEFGRTLGFDPASLNYSTVGGWIATNAHGHFSMRYGAIDAIVQEVDVVSPNGQSVRGVAPAPVLGAEGRSGIVTAATLRIHAVPEVGELRAWRHPAFGEGLAAVRSALDAGVRLSAARLYDRAAAAGFAEATGIGIGGTLLVTAVHGARAEVEPALARLDTLLDRAGGVPLGPEPAQAWFDARYRADWLLDGNEPEGRMADRVDVIAPWARLVAVAEAGRAALGRAGATASAVVSQFHASGAIVTFDLAIRARDDRRVIAAYRSAVDALTRAAAAAGGRLLHERVRP